MLFFISPLYCSFRRSKFNSTLLYHNEGEIIPTRTSTSLSHSLRVPSLLALCENHKKPEIDKKIQVWETLTETLETLETLTEGSVFSSCRCLKQSVSRLLTLNWSKHFIRCGCFQICSGNNNTLLLCACEAFHLINKGVISPYVRSRVEYF